MIAALAACSGLALSMAAFATAPAAVAGAWARGAGADGMAGSSSAPAPIPLNNANWSGNAGFASRPPAWYNDKSGIVHLQGAVTQTSSSGTGAKLIGTLPPAARPSHNVFTIVHTFNGTYTDLAIGSNGQITVIALRSPMATDVTFVSLESVTYRR